MGVNPQRDAISEETCARKSTGESPAFGSGPARCPLASLRLSRVDGTQLLKAEVFFQALKLPRKNPLQRRALPGKERQGRAFGAGSLEKHPGNERQKATGSMKTV